MWVYSKSHPFVIIVFEYIKTQNDEPFGYFSFDMTFDRLNYGFHDLKIGLVFSQIWIDGLMGVSEPRSDSDLLSFTRSLSLGVLTDAVNSNLTEH